MKSSNPHSGIYEADTSRTLDLNCGNPTCNQGGIAIVNPFVPSPPQSKDAVVFEPGSCSRVGGHIWQDGKTPSLRADPGDNHPAIVLENHPADSRVKIAEDGVVQTLNARMGTGGGQCSFDYVLDARWWNIATPEQPMFTLTATNYKEPPVVIMEVKNANV